MFSLICAWINSWVNNGEAGDLRRYRTHYDVMVMLTRDFDMDEKFYPKICMGSNWSFIHYLSMFNLDTGLFDNPLLVKGTTEYSLPIEGLCAY